MTTVETFSPELDGGTGGVSVDRDGNVYVADFGAILSDAATAGRKVLRLGADGSPSVFVTGLDGASGNRFDSRGNLYQSSIRGNFISRIAPDGQWVECARDGIIAPVGLVIDADDVLFVACCNANRIQRVTRDGRSEAFAESPLFRCPNGITLDDEHNLYVANFENGDVLRVTPDGLVSPLAIVPGENNGHILYHEGFLYVVARGAHQIYRVSLTGEVSLFAGTGRRGRDDGPALQATFSYPNGIDVAPDGRSFYINEIASSTSEGNLLSPMIVRRIRLDAR